MRSVDLACVTIRYSTNYYKVFCTTITLRRMQSYRAVCRNVGGEEFAARAVQKLTEQGYINAVQRYFGLHYVADQLPLGNDELLQLMKKAGFSWFERYDPPDEK